MLDHIGFPVSDYARSKAFYESALRPLGYGLVMEVTPEMFEMLEAIYEPPVPAELESAVLSVSDAGRAAAPGAAQPEAVD